MSMVSFPFDSKITGYDDSGYPQYDRAVNSSVLANMLNSLATTGVLLNDTNAFSVSAGDNMLVKVHAGSAIINGITCIEDTERTLSLQAADTTYDRIDTVVLRLNTSVDVRAIDLYVVKGTAAASPVAPVLTRSGSVYELGLANVYIPANVITITNERITDTRGDSFRCGYSVSAGYAGLLSQINNIFYVETRKVYNYDVEGGGSLNEKQNWSSSIKKDGYIPISARMNLNKTILNSYGMTSFSLVVTGIEESANTATSNRDSRLKCEVTTIRPDYTTKTHVEAYCDIYYIKTGV